MSNASAQRLVDFCRSIIAANYDQRLAILRHIGKEQCGFIRQIAFNVLLNDDLELISKDRQYLQRHLTSLKELASRQICYERKRLILVKKHLLIKRLARIAIGYLG